MISNIRLRIAIPVIGILFLLVTFHVLYVAQTVQNFSVERSDERLQGASQAARAYFERIERYNQMTARAISGDENIIAMVQKWNNDNRCSYVRENLFAFFEEAREYYAITNIVIAGKCGYVIMRTSYPERFGDSSMVSPIFSEAILYGRSSTVYTSSDVTLMGLSSAAPIVENGVIIGAVAAVVNLDREYFVDSFAEIFNAEVTVFKGDTSVASTLYKNRETGERAIDTTARQDIIETVLGKGEPFDAELELFGSWYHAYYFPLLGWEHEPVGMFFIGFSLEDSIAATNTLTMNLIMIGGAALTFAAFVIFKIINHIDQTERNAIKAEAANKAKTEFLSTMSHEIRTPLGAILGIAEIQIRLADSGKIKEAFEKIYSSGGMLLGLINDILDLSKIEAGKMELLSERYEVASLIGDTAQLNILRRGSKPVNFEVFASEELPSFLYGNELRIKQILNNILSNAFKYTSEGSVKLCVSHETVDEENIILVLCVSDTGQGMTKEQQNHLFDKFRRFNHDANRETEGFGLGMSIAKNIVVAMGGKIDVESEPKKGSFFTVRIPQKISNPAPMGRETAENLSKFKYIGQVNLIQTEWEPMPYGRVLVVDDIDTNIYVTKGFLEPYMLQVDSAESGFDALDKVKKGNVYDLILLDHMMPKMDGIETALRLRRELNYIGSIVAFTANALVGQEEEFMKKGFDGFVSKPIQSTHLDSVLKKFIRDKQKPEVIAAARAIENHTTARTHSINFQKLCKDFAKSQKNVIARLQDTLVQKDYSEATLIAHTLRSLAGLIGESHLVRLAGEAEAEFRKENNPTDLLNELGIETQRILIDLNEKIKVELPHVNPMDESEVRLILEDLKVMLSENSGEVINMIPILPGIAGTEKIIEYIEAYDLELALAEVEEILAERC